VKLARGGVIPAVTRLGRAILVAIFVVFFTACAFPAAPQTASPDSSNQGLKQLTLEQLGNIEVTTPSKQPTEVWQTPAAIYVITQDDIRRSGATSIPEALRLAPGVEVARIDSDHWAIGIRGFGSQFSKSVLVLIDGRIVYTPLFAGVYWAIQNYVLEDIDRIEVIRGPGGTIWGSNAVDGVINIITKSALNTEGVLVSALGGNIDQGMGSIRYGWRNKKVGIRVYAKGFSRGPEFDPRGADFDRWHSFQAGFRGDRESGNNSFSIHTDLYQSVEGLQVQNATFSAPFTQIINGTDTFAGGNTVGQWQHKFSETSDLNLEVYWDNTFQRGPQGIETRNTFNFDFVHRFALNKWNEITWGAGALVSPSRFVSTEPAHSFIPESLTSSIYSGFIQDEIRITKQVHLTLGSKFEDDNYTGLEIEPTARLLYAPTDHQSVWAAVTRAVRMPARLDEDFSLYLLALQSPLIYAHVVGNHNLSSEALLGDELGYRVLATPRLYLDFAAFHNQYNGLVGLGNTVLGPANTPPTAPPQTYLVGTLPWVNAVHGHTDGFEIAPNWQPFSWWQLKGSYSYLHLNLKTNTGLKDLSTQQMYMGSAPHHEIFIQSVFTIPHGFEFDPTYRYVSSLPFQHVTGYSTMDLRGSKMIGKLTLSLVGQNLFQPHHFEFSNDPTGLVGIERAVYGQIVWQAEPKLAH